MSPSIPVMIPTQSTLLRGVPSRGTIDVSVMRQNRIDGKSCMASERLSLAYDEFKRITGSDAVEVMRAMIGSDPPTLETEWREFKAYPWEDFKEPLSGCDTNNLKDKKTDFIKKTWSECMSAFANTQGGVL